MALISRLYPKEEYAMATIFINSLADAFPGVSRRCLRDATSILHAYEPRLLMVIPNFFVPSDGDIAFGDGVVYPFDKLYTGSFGLYVDYVLTTSMISRNPLEYTEHMHNTLIKQWIASTKTRR